MFALVFVVFGVFFVSSGSRCLWILILVVVSYGV